MIAFIATLSCTDKEEDKLIPEEPKEITTNYRGVFREYGSYVTTINDSLHLVNYDSSKVNSFIITTKGDVHSLTRIDQYGKSVNMKSDFTLNQNNEYGDTSGSGSSHYHIYIKMQDDTLYLDEAKASGMPNVAHREVKAKKID